MVEGGGPPLSTTGPATVVTCTSGPRVFRNHAQGVDHRIPVLKRRLRNVDHIPVTHVEGLRVLSL
jgi:hypothetical protein